MWHDPVGRTIMAWLLYRAALTEPGGACGFPAYTDFHNLWTKLSERDHAEYVDRIRRFCEVRRRLNPPEDDDREAIQEGDYHYYNRPEGGGPG